jgi:hypothetical protein
MSNKPIVIRDTPSDSRRIQRVQLEAYDDVTSIRDRLQYIKTRRVLLVFPKDQTILQRKLDLVLIQRECARRNLRLALVTPDPVIATHAKELNISAFTSIEQARTNRWKRPLNKVFVDRQDRPKSPHDPYELMVAASRLKPPVQGFRKNVQRVLRGIILGITLLSLFFGAYTVVPSATVTVTPAQDQLNITIPIFADPSIDTPLPEALRIPARTQQFLQDVSVSIETTGVRRIEDALSEGTVIFTNETSTETIIPVGTVVRTDATFTSAPVEFETLEAITLEARRGATAETRVRARAVPSSSGVAGNVNSETVVAVIGVLADVVSVVNPEPIRGGGLRESAFVTAADQERLLNLARYQVVQNARNFLASSLDEGTTLFVPESVIIVDERSLYYTPDLNAVGETASLTMQVTIEATIINLDEAKLVAFANLGGYIPQGREIDEDSLRYVQGEANLAPTGEGYVFRMRVEGNTRARIDPTQIQERLAGVSEEEAQTILETEYLLDPRQPPQIEISPGFINRMPFLPVRIHVEVTD